MSRTSRITLIIFATIILLFLAYLAFYYYSMRNVKTPSYQVLNRQGAVELRKYPSLILAEVTVNGPASEALSNGFEILADYISGYNTTPDSNQSQRIKMTAPVIQTHDSAQKTANGQQWKIRFLMPSNFTLETLPQPKNSKIKIYKQPPQTIIVIRFKGSPTQEAFNKKLKQLQKHISDNNIQIIGAPMYAYYNPPWTLPFMRRNEVMLIVKNGNIKKP